MAYNVFICLSLSIGKAELQTAKKRKRNLILSCLYTKGLLQPELDQAEIRKLVLHTSLPQDWQEPKHLSHHQLPPMIQ